MVAAEKPFIDDRANQIGDVDMEKREEEKDRLLNNRRKTQHGVMP